MEPWITGGLNWSRIWFERGDLRPLFIPCISQGLFLDSALFLLYINDLSVILCNIATYADDTILYSRYEQTCWIWTTRHYRLGQSATCWFQCWKNSTCGSNSVLYSKTFLKLNLLLPLVHEKLLRNSIFCVKMVGAQRA